MKYIDLDGNVHDFDVLKELGLVVSPLSSDDVVIIEKANGSFKKITYGELVKSLCASVLTQSGDITDSLHSVNARELNASLSGTLAWIINDIKTKLGIQDGNVGKGFYEIRPTKHEDSILLTLHADTSFGSVGTWSSGNSQHQYSIYSVEGGETYLISGGVPESNTRYVVAAFYDDNGNYVSRIEREDNLIQYIDYSVVVPTGATQLVIIRYGSNDPQICDKKVYDLTGSIIIDELIENSYEFTSKIEDIETAIDENTLTFDTSPTLNSTNPVTSGGVYNAIPKNIVDGTGTGAVIEGKISSNTSGGEYAHAEGSSTVASGSSTHAEGNGTTASGSYAHAEGRYSLASGTAAHAEGFGGTATAWGSHAEGTYTKAESSNQHVFGKYNVSDTHSTFVEIVGNGTGENRSNCRTLDWNGNERLTGSITLGDGTNNEVTLTAQTLKALIAQLGG